MNAKDIAKGFFNNLTNREDLLYKERIAICRSCKLLKNDNMFGEICSNDLFLNPNTDEISRENKKGFFSGCGCILRAKTRVPEARCPLNRW